MLIYNCMGVSEELSLQRWGRGFKLVKLDEKNFKCESEGKSQINSRLIDILNQPFSVYFYDLNHRFQCVNDIFIKVGDFTSKESVLNKTVAEVFPKTSEYLVRNNISVTNERETKILEEEIFLTDEVHQQFISIKSPLYDEENNIVGILGCSVLLGTDSLVYSLQEIVKLGMLNASWVTTEKLGVHSGYMKLMFSKRERDCLYFLVRGKTIKEIAKAINISPRTVETYIENIKIKTKKTSRSELIEYIVDFIY